MNKNNYVAKLKRTITSILPVSKKRRGSCNNCGKCCSLPNPCWFLRTSADGKTHCAIYKIRPLNCRKYPRTESELLTADSCGYHFEK
ncbi:MAG: hypothetical protein WCK37_01585 [Candidatus Falkowbacteria bacterium]